MGVGSATRLISPANTTHTEHMTPGGWVGGCWTEQTPHPRPRTPICPGAGVGAKLCVSQAVCVRTDPPVVRLLSPDLASEADFEAASRELEKLAGTTGKPGYLDCFDEMKGMPSWLLGYDAADAAQHILSAAKPPTGVKVQVGGQEALMYVVEVGSEEASLGEELLAQLERRAAALGNASGSLCGCGVWRWREPRLGRPGRVGTCAWGGGRAWLRRACGRSCVNAGLSCTPHGERTWGRNGCGTVGCGLPTPGPCGTTCGTRLCMRSMGTQWSLQTGR